MDKGTSIKKAKDNLIKFLNEFSQSNKKDLNIEVMFVDKNYNRKNKFKGYMFDASKNDIQPVITTTLRKIEKRINDKGLCGYDLVNTAEDDYIEVIDKGLVRYGEDIINQITIVQNVSNTVNKNTNFSKLDFIVMQVHFGEYKAYLFYPHFKSEKMLKGFKFGFAVDGKPILIDSEILTINSDPTAMLIGEKYYVFKRHNFKSIFKMSENLIEIIDENIDRIEKLDIFEDIQPFIVDCKKNSRHVEKLVKAITQEDFDVAAKYKDSLGDVIDNHKLRIQINSEHKIIYNDISEINQILNLILDNYVETSLTEEYRTAKSFE